MANLIGSLQAMSGAYVFPLCQWPGCRDAAQTTGLVHGRLSNVCPKHKMMSQRQAQKRGGRKS